MKKLITLTFFVLLFQIVNAQNNNLLKGNIFDNNKKPLKNVSISIKNTTKGTNTNKNGAFELQTTSNKITLLVSNIGFETQKINVKFQKNKNTNIQIQLNEITYQLEEVIVSSNPSIVENSIINARLKQKSIAGGTNIISMKGLDTQRSLTLKDALQLQPGIILQEFFGANDQPRLNIRGSGIQSNPQSRGLNLLQDGISINFSDGSYIIGALEPRSAKYIEVFRGANALKYGASSLGGAINLVSKNGYNASALELKLETGSFNYFGGSISSGIVFGKNDLYTAVSYNDAKGFREFNTSSRFNALVNIGRKFNDVFESRLYINYTDLKFDIPGPLTQAQIDENPKQISTGINMPISIGPNVIRDKPARTSSLFRIANKSVYKINNNNKITFGLQYQYGDDTFITPMAVGIQESKSDDFGINIAFNTQNAKNSLSVGVNTRIGKIDRAYFVNLKGEKGKQYTDNKLSSTNIVFYIEDIYKLTSKLSGIANLQLSSNTRNNKENFATPTTRPFFSFKTKSYGTFASSDTSLDQDYFGFNPKLGLIYSLKNQQQLFVNVSRSYEPPTFNELINKSKGNPNQSPKVFKSIKLNEQTATTLELGTRGAYKKINWDLSLYHSLVKNEILTTTDLFGISGTTRNSPDKTIHQGLELGFGASLFKNIFSQNKDEINFKGVYNYSNFYFNKGIYKDNQIAGIPKHYIASSLEYKHPNGIFASVNTEWLPEKTPTDHQNTIFQKSYQLMGIRLGYNKSKWSLFVEGKNITDTKYASSYLIRDVVINPKPPVLTPKNVTTFIPGAGINFIVGLNYKL
ncbi:TonB-dependent receptor [Tenacibaculum finnmarkense genomovar ulcerans]|uniref:TonB-dependent receptor n=1 Tax=Tenacibaculum finnmarkense TaxID=2781243 RepID=UPI001E59BC00|nr:TonB-dependent receptor [Tenacibaculum finnmarkense]MCD8453265.1 TonB-dependent receptor [Tenacibaculum finnmarkense genomovar ulcerans]